MAEERKVWDCVVIGSGIIGLSTAYYLNKAGIKTLVLEQFHLPHTRGSSHGQSRLIRKCHEIEEYVKMTLTSYELWEDIEKESGQQLIIKTGLLLMQDKEAVDIKKAKHIMAKNKLDHEWLTGADIKKRYPMIRYSDDIKALFDKSASILIADKCLQAVTNLVESNGGVIRDGVQVIGINPGKIVTIQSNQGEFYAKKVVIAAGSWSKDVLALVGLDIPLKTMPGLVCYWKSKNQPTYDTKVFPSVLENRFNVSNVHSKGYRMIYAVPSFEYYGMVKTMPGSHMYWKCRTSEEYSVNNIPQLYQMLPTTREGYRFFLLFPSVDYPGLVKIVTRGEPAPFYCHPDDRDTQNMDESIDLLSDYIKQHLPGIETRPSIIEPCMYCMTPDKMCIMDKHPTYSNIIVGTGFSGKGFMLAPLAGKILKDLVEDVTPQWDISSFSLRRFASSSSSKL